MSTGVVALGVFVAVLVGVFGLYGASEADHGTTVAARVVTGSPCDRADATETVSFTLGGRDRTARFDGCGHAQGEPVDITVPVGSLGGELVVHAAQATVGDRQDGADLGRLLIVVSGVAGAGYAFLVRRGPRTNRLPPALRPA